MNAYTDVKFWEDYWEGIKINPTGKVFFENLTKNFPLKGEVIEIGGFPGKLIVYFCKKKNCTVTILDYFISEKIVEKVEKINNLKKGTINIIKADFLNTIFDRRYDIVTSHGFIEHFEDTKDIINRHVELLKSNGKLLITLPNFRGFNGWIQKIFDKKNYDVHNIKSMDTELLREICNSLKLKDIEVNYFSRPTIWLEKAKESFIIRCALIPLKLLLFLAPGKNKFFSPFIYIKATK